MDRTLEELMGKRRERQRPTASGERFIYRGEPDGYRVRIRWHGRKHDFGTYDELSDAIAVRDAALKRLEELG